MLRRAAPLLASALLPLPLPLPLPSLPTAPALILAAASAAAWSTLAPGSAPHRHLSSSTSSSSSSSSSYGRKGGSSGGDTRWTGSSPPPDADAVPFALSPEGALAAYSRWRTSGLLGLLAESFASPSAQPGARPALLPFHCFDVTGSPGFSWPASGSVH